MLAAEYIPPFGGIFLFIKYVSVKNIVLNDLIKIILGVVTYFVFFYSHEYDIINKNVKG